MQYNKIPVVMDQFNYLWEPKIIKNLYFEKARPLSAQYFTGYIGIPIWIAIMTKLDIFQD